MTLILLLRPDQTVTQALAGTSAGYGFDGATVIPNATLLPGSSLKPTEAVLTVVISNPPFLVMPPRIVG